MGDKERMSIGNKSEHRVVSLDVLQIAGIAAVYFPDHLYAPNTLLTSSLATRNFLYASCWASACAFF